MSAKCIDLTRPIEWHGQHLTRLFVLEPTAAHAHDFGEPRFAMGSKVDGFYWVEREDVVKRYLDALLSPDGSNLLDGGTAILSSLSLQDGLELKEALFDFFAAARLAISLKRQTNSSSA